MAIEKPINVFTVANQLGYYEYAPHPVTGQTVRKVDLGRLCTHANINKWSKWKPVRHFKIGDINLGNLEDRDFGLDVPKYDSVEELVDAISLLPMPGEESNKPIWKYLKPRGGSYNEPYRLGDFRGYNHRAVKPFGIFNVTSRASKQGGSSIIMGSIGAVESTEKQLGLSDFMHNRALAIAYRQGSQGTLRTAVGAQGATSVSIDVNNPSLSTGIYSAWLFLSNNYLNTNSDLIGFEGHPYQLTFQVVDKTVTLTLDARWLELEPDKINVKVRVQNSTGDPVNLPNCFMRFRNAQNDCRDPYENHEKLVNLGDLVAPPGDNIIVNHTETVNRDAFGSWKICWSNLGMYDNEFAINILTPMD